MKKIFIYSFFLFILINLNLLSTNLQAQNDSIEIVEEHENFWANGKEVGINVTNLASRFVPFNLSSKDNFNQYIALRTKWYGSGSRAFILNIGFEMEDELTNDQNFFVGIGYERRRNISEKWKYVTGWEFIGSNFGSPFNDGYVGLSKPYGIEYHFYDNFYISTEARLIVGFGNEFILNLSYPTSIFFNMLLE